MLQTETEFLQVFKRLRASEELYDATCLKIRAKSGELLPLKWNFAQRFVTERLEKQLQRDGRVRAVILKARQEGVSTQIAARFYRKVNLWDGRKALIIANALENAEAIFAIYERYHNHLPVELQPGKVSGRLGRSLKYAHDSEIAVRPASDKEAGRAQTIHFLHASEIAFWPDNSQREVWVSATSAVPDYDSEIIVESTANGAGGLFYELWERALNPASGWEAIFLPWWIHEEYDCGPDNPPLQDEFDAIATNPDDFEQQALGPGIPWEGREIQLPLSRLVWRRRKIINQFGGDPVTLGKDATREFQQEFPATAEEAFIMSGATYFDEEEIRLLARNCREPEVLGRLVVNKDEDGKRHLELQKSPRGIIRVWELPDEKGHYTIGCDTAEGKLVASKRALNSTEDMAGDRDFSSATVLRIDGPQVKLVATLHGHISSDVFAAQVALLGEWYACGGPKEKTRRDNCLILVENNHSSGQRVLQYLWEKLGYKHLYWKRQFNTRTNLFEKSLGWRTDERSREILLDGLGELIRKRQILVPDPATVKELSQFVLSDTGKPQALDGAHDDRVFSSALAVAGRKEHRHASTVPPVSFIPEPTGSGL